MQQQKSKWKAWHFITLGVIAVIIFGLFKLTSSATPAKIDLPQNASSDSATRQKKIESAFSTWDGSHKNLVAYIKKNMNDPESFEHVETKMWDMGSDTIVVKMSYRGKNAFGGKVTEMVRAKALIDGSLLEVAKQ